MLKIFRKKYKKNAFRVVAFLPVRNGELYVERCLRHLYEQGIHTCLIDNGSTDATVDIARTFLDLGVIRIENLPYRGSFELEKILKLEQQLSQEIEADWFIHHDVDEIREAPSVYQALIDGIRDADSQGYNAINFDEFVFLPHRDDVSYEGCDYVRAMKYYYFFEPNKFRRVNAWKRQKRVDLVSSGGHMVSFSRMKIFPVNFIMRHYFALSYEHLLRKYLGRKFSEKEITERGWHRVRSGFNLERALLPDVHQLKNITAGVWDKSDAWKQHSFIGPETLPVPFIVGVSRSGTTLLRLMLDSHPDLAIPHETHFVPKLASPKGSQSDLRKKFLNIILESERWCDFQIDAESFRESVAQLPDFTIERGLRHFYMTYAEMHNKKRWGDKTPLYQLNMAAIQSCIPESHFIHIIRDGRDVAVSMRKLWFGAGENIRDQALRWKERIIATRKQAKKIPYYMEIKYENLINNPEGELRNIASFLQLPFDESMLGYYRNAEERLNELTDLYAEDGSMKVSQSKRKNIHALVSREPDRSRIGRWKSKLSSDDIELYEELAGDMLVELGYEVSK